MNKKTDQGVAVDQIVLSSDKDVVDYVERFADTMILMTAGRDMSTLRYFLDMVRAEAAELGKIYKQQ